MASVASFDIFDTLLTRTVARPEHLFYEIGLGLSALGFISIPAERFAALRQETEKEERQRGTDGETTLAAIYATLGAALNWSPELRKKAAALEMEFEANALRAIPAGRDRLEGERAKGRRIAFLSDMYLPSTFIRAQLVRHGMWRDGDDLLVSSEQGGSKANGTLYRLLKERFGKNAIHVGNHPDSDIVQARKAGVKALFADEGNLTSDEELLASHAGNTSGLASHLAAAARLTRLSIPVATKQERLIRDISATVAAPALACYVHWLLNRAREMGLQRLYFLSRDGQILLRIAERLPAWSRRGLDLRYLHASRRSWHPASIVDDAGPSKLGWLCDDTTFLSVQSACARGQIAPESISEVLQEFGFQEKTWNANLSADERHRLRRVFSDTRTTKQLGSRAMELRGPLCDYFRKSGLYDRTPWAIVDLGWNGRLQDSLADIMRATGGPVPLGFYFALESGTPDEGRGGRRYAYLYDKRTQAGLCNTNWEIIPVLETFCAADHGTVLGFKAQGDDVVPVLKESQNLAAEKWGLRVMQDSILALASHLTDAVSNPDLISMRAGIAQMLTRFIENPSYEEAEAWGSFPYEDDQTAVAPRLLAEPLTLLDAIQAYKSEEIPRPHRSALKAASLKLTARPVRFLLRFAVRLPSRLRRIKREQLGLLRICRLSHAED